jgi:hypothetical protein
LGVYLQQGTFTMISRATRTFGVFFLSAVILLVFSSGDAALAGETDNGAAGRDAWRAEPAAGPENGGDEAAAEAAARAEIMQSDEMLKALIWFDEYFAASAECTGNEREALEAKLAGMSSIELRRFLLEFERERQLAKERQAAVEQQRRQSLARGRDYLREQQAARNAALSRSYRGSNRRFFGTTPDFHAGKAKVTPQRYSAFYPPLITSLEMARYGVYRSLFGRRW